ncbi:MAG: S8 family serine peptidase, partial [Candidatus Margulisbacteria bacterium]|nr:S8 family serine peptidase [Candidatus Margulisiibacteriota bacterium]
MKAYNHVKGVNVYPKNGITTVLIIFVFSLFFCLPSFSYNQAEYEQAILKERETQRTLETEKYYDERIGEYVDVVAGEILVKFKPSVSAQSINLLSGKNHLKIVRALQTAGAYLFSVSDEGKSISVKEMVEIYKKLSNVEYAEPNFIYHGFSVVPNDVYYSLQWGLATIEAPLAWCEETGISNVIIAVVDSGIDLLHPDLINKLMTSPGGWDFVDNDSDPSDELGHGTHVAGIAAASTDNNLGIAGLSWGCKIMAVRVIDANNQASTTDVSDGIIYAANNGANVINLSLGGPGYSSEMNAAIQYAHSKGCVIAASAGNDGMTTNYVNYPASYDNVISVAATNNSDSHAYYSTYNNYVDVSAPGGELFYLHDPRAIYS